MYTVTPLENQSHILKVEGRARKYITKLLFEKMNTTLTTAAKVATSVLTTATLATTVAKAAIVASSGFNGGQIAGIVIAGICGVALLALAIWGIVHVARRKRQRTELREDEL